MNDLRLKPFDFNAAVARAGLRPDGLPRADAAEAGSFKTAMAEALSQVSQTQNQAQQMERAVLMGQPGASLEQTVIAATKANVGFQAVLQVRNRLAQAYSDIMNMQV